MTMSLRHLRFVFHALLVSSLLAFGLPGVALAQDEDEDGDNVLESDEVSGDDEESSTTIVVRDTDPSAVVIFRDRLSPYGSWVDHPTYGSVWVPSSAVVGDDFAPYVSAGRWELTEDGDWLWVSEYDWGYIPFHYGRWVWVSDMGWAWIPGRVYAPAWVVWRTGADGYIGWAPMPPAYYWHDGYAVTLWVVPPAAYVFCHGHHVFDHHVHHHVFHDHADVHRAVSHTAPYRPANPSKAGTSHKPAQPTTKEAGVPRKSIPKNFGKDDPKATAFMKPGTRGIPAPSKASAPSRGSAKSNAAQADRGSARSSSKSLGTTRGATSRGSKGDEARFSKPKRGSFSSESPPSRGNAQADRGSSRSAPPASAPSNGDAPRSRKATKSRPSNDSSSRGSSDSSSSSSDRSPPPSRSSRPSSSPSRSAPPPSAGSGRSKSRPAAPPPSSVKRSAPSRGGGRGRR